MHIGPSEATILRHLLETESKEHLATKEKLAQVREILLVVQQTGGFRLGTNVFDPELERAIGEVLKLTRP